MIREALSDDDYAAFQWMLADRPDAGAVIKGGGGIRKIRWALPGRGKRGGARVVYYWRNKEDQVYLLYLFAKNARSDLTPAQVSELAKYAKELK